MKYLQAIAAFSLLFDTIAAQDISRKILMVVDRDTVTAGEFKRMYLKSADTFSLEQFEDYLQQYIDFKLKVADAVSLGYDTTESFRVELRGYRNQLASEYLSDNEVKEKILRQAYQRLMTEIDAWHILVACPPESTPDDTLSAWKKTLEIKARISGGESFETVARSVSDDPSVRLNGGHLGYFTAFQMITPFEDAAYSLKKGRISEPVRTPYGYHLIKVADIRPSKGKIRVAHIMISSPPDADPSVVKTTEDTIKSVYRQLVQGASFSDLAMKYSDHRESTRRGGELNWFGAGEISSDFAEAAFSLKADGDFTAPVRTVYGWHIIKRLEAKGPPTWEEAKSALESRISESWLNTSAVKSLVNKLMKEYNYRVNGRAFNWFINNTDTLITRGYSKYDRRALPAEPLCTYAGRSVSTYEFAGFIESKASKSIRETPESLLRNLLDTYVSDHILDYENSILESKYPAFSLLMKEFHDGILLFDISQKKIWNRAMEDSAGLREFYERQKGKYPGEKVFTGMIGIMEQTGKEKSFRKAFSKYRKYPDIEKRLRKKLTSADDTLIKVFKGTFHESDQRLPADFRFVKGTHNLTIGGFPAVIVVDEVKAGEPKSFETVKEELVPLYQEWLEDEWVKQLRNTFSVKINSETLAELKKMLSDV